MRELLSWELNDHMKLVMFLFTIPVLAYLLAVTYLQVNGGLGTREGIPPWNTTSSITSTSSFNWLLVYPSLAFGFWIVLALFISLITVFTFRYDRDKGYALTVYTLPYSKRALFSAKLLSAFILSLLPAVLSLFGVYLLLNADIWGMVWALMKTRFFWYFIILLLYFEVFTLSVAVFFGVLTRNMLASFMATFFLIVVPYFSSVYLPPFVFVQGIGKILSVNPFSTNFLLQGVLLPAFLLLASLVLFERRDVV